MGEYQNREQRRAEIDAMIAEIERDGHAFKSVEGSVAIAWFMAFILAGIAAWFGLYKLAVWFWGFLSW